MAVDPSPSFVAACRQRFPEVDVRPGAAEALPVDDASFDRAVAQLVIHFVTDPARSAAEMRRAVRPGGLVGVCVWDGADGMGLLHVVSEARRAVEGASGEPEVRPFGQEGELADLLAGAGLDDVEEELLGVTVRYTGFDELWDSLLEGIGPAGAYVVSLSLEARAHYREVLLDLVGRPDGEFTLSATARAARGVGQSWSGIRSRQPVTMTSGSSIRGLAATTCLTVTLVKSLSLRTMPVSVSPDSTR